MTDQRYIIGDCIKVMKKEIDKESIDLIVTSPPYNCGMEYEGAPVTESLYSLFIQRVTKAMNRVLKPDGRIALNIAININNENTKNFPTSYLWDKGLRKHFNYYDTIIWSKGNSGCDTAWGSFCSSSAPYLRHCAEHILLFHKGPEWKRGKREDNITSRQFTRWTEGMWKIKPEHKSDHPAPIPLSCPTVVYYCSQR